MKEYTYINAPSAGIMVTRLTDLSKDGWKLVTILHVGNGDFTAFLSRGWDVINIGPAVVGEVA